jgi:D-alanyl-D-alanine dipeptidase
MGGAWRQEKLRRKGDTLQNSINRERAGAVVPHPVPDRWRGLIGEYGPEANVLFVLEKDGKLQLLRERALLQPLTEESADRFRLPGSGLSSGEAVNFQRTVSGKATAVLIAGKVSERRVIDGEDGTTFKIKPVRSIKAIREEALQARPPVAAGAFCRPALVDLSTIDSAFRFEIRYATDNNFMGTPIYTSARAFLQRPAAEALRRASTRLAEQGFGLLVYDAYRPWYVTWMFWEATPQQQRMFVADPSQGSRHNRGCAIDLTLHDHRTIQPVEMTSGFDEFSDRAYPNYPGGTSLQRWHREILREAMEAEGFIVSEVEWWHFDYRDWRKYPILNEPFEDLR